MASISVVIITFNEEKHISKTVKQALKLTDDIIIVDSFSTDKTAQICNELGCNFFQNKWPGYSEQKNLGVSKAKHNWILSIDADEVLSDSLIEELKNIQLEKISFQAFDIPFETYFCGKIIKYGGWNPESHVRLYHKQVVSWKIDDVHEKLDLTNCKIGKLKGKINHYTVDDIQDFRKKTEVYSNLYAENLRRYSRHKNKTLLSIKMLLSPLVRFIKEYFLRLGCFDGYYGWVIAIENSRYTFLKYYKSIK